MLNRCEFIGRVGRDVEFRTMSDGSPVANLSLGVTDTWKDKQTGEKREKTEWIRCVVFNEGLCKVLQNYVNKGDLIRIVGSMQTRKWTDQSGAEKYTTEVVLQRYRGELTMLGGRSDTQQQGSDYQAPMGGAADLDDEIPF